MTVLRSSYIFSNISRTTTRRLHITSTHSWQQPYFLPPDPRPLPPVRSQTCPLPPDMSVTFCQLWFRPLGSVSEAEHRAWLRWPVIFPWFCVCTVDHGGGGVKHLLLLLKPAAVTSWNQEHGLNSGGHNAAGFRSALSITSPQVQRTQTRTWSWSWWPAGQTGAFRAPLLFTSLLRWFIFKNTWKATFFLVSRAATCRRSAVCSLVRLKAAVDRAVLRRRVGEVGAALPPGLREDPVEEAGGAVRRRSWGPVESQRPLDAVSSQQFRSTATTAGQKKSGGSDFVPEPPIILLLKFNFIVKFI